jgi:hypothetical protein
MSKNEMGYRGSKSVYIKDTVKEQRVDGSCFGHKPKLRCTLMGNERSYQVKIPSNQINNIKYYSSNSYSVLIFFFADLFLCLFVSVLIFVCSYFVSFLICFLSYFVSVLIFFFSDLCLFLFFSFLIFV